MRMTEHDGDGRSLQARCSIVGSRLRGWGLRAEAGRGVVGDHADCLHERVADRRADERKAAPFEVRAHRVGLGGPRQKVLEPSWPVDPRPTPHKAPDVRVERAKLSLNGEKGPSVLHGALNLEAV